MMYVTKIDFLKAVFVNRMYPLSYNERSCLFFDKCIEIEVYWSFTKKCYTMYVNKKWS